MKALALLRAWLAPARGPRRDPAKRTPLDRLAGHDVAFDGPEEPKTFAADRVVLALGGPSWPYLGGNGDWAAALESPRADARAVGGPPTAASRSPGARASPNASPGAPIPTATFRCGDREIRGNATVTTVCGIEGGAVYAPSPPPCATPSPPKEPLA